MHHFSAHSLQSFFKNQLNELYVSMTLRSFAFSLVGIFVPAYLLTRGYSLQAVFIFLCVLHATHALFAFFAARIAMRIGFSFGALLSIPFFVAFYFFLYTLDSHHWPLWLIGVFGGIGNPLFWMAYHIDFMSCSAGQRRGEQVGTMKVVSSAATALAPIFGALLITTVGFHALILVVIALLLLSAVPLFFARNQTFQGTISLADVFRFQKVKDAFTLIVHGFDEALGGTAWPVFLFLFVEKTYTFIGIASSITLVASFIAVFLIGKRSNHHARKVLRFGSVVSSLVWMVRILWARTPGIVYLTNAIGGLVTSAVTIPVTVLIYERTSDQHSCRPLIALEIFFHLGQVLLFAFLALTVQFWAAFALGVFAPVVYFLF